MATPRKFVLISLVTFSSLLGLTGAQLDAGPRFADKHVFKRAALMNIQKTSIDTLSSMSSGRIVFDAELATLQRKILMRTTRSIPKHFRRQRMEPNSNARKKLWKEWSEFKARAQVANQMANRLNTRSIAGLRRSLPDLIGACHACHSEYRRQPNSFITH